MREFRQIILGKGLIKLNKKGTFLAKVYLVNLEGQVEIKPTSSEVIINNID